MADLRYHNPHLSLKRLPSADGPVVLQVVVEREGREPTVLEGGKFKSPGELRERLLELNQEGM